jgi:hypothetical protein
MDASRVSSGVAASQKRDTACSYLEFSTVFQGENGHITRPAVMVCADVRESDRISEIFMQKH